MTDAASVPSGSTGTPSPPSTTPSWSIPWVQIAKAVEWAIVGTVATFLGSLSQFPGGAWDTKHLAAAGIGALSGFSAQLASILNNVRTTNPKGM